MIHLVTGMEKSKGRVSKYLSYRRPGKWTWRVRPEYADRAQGIEDRIEQAKKGPHARSIKKTDGRRDIWAIPLVKGSDKMAFVKHYSRPRFSKQLKYFVRKSRTLQEWEMGLKLEGMGLPVPRHLAMGERRVLGLLQEDYLVQESLEGYRDFESWFREKWQGVKAGPEIKRKREDIRSLAELVRRMHDKGVLQRDFKADSVMVGPEGDFKLVDLERALIVKDEGGLSITLRIANLAKIDQALGFIASIADRLRFLGYYFQGDNLTREKLREYARRIGELAELEFRKQAQDRREWIMADNVSFRRYRFPGFRVISIRMVPSESYRPVIKKIQKAAELEHVLPEIDGRPGLELKGYWCDALNAMANGPNLKYRRVPYVLPVAALIPNSSEQWGIFLSAIPPQPFVTLATAAATAAESEASDQFAADLGRVLRVLHRMGITWREHRPDCMYYHPAEAEPMSRFYVNRLDLLVLDRTPEPEEAERILADIQRVIGLSSRQGRVMREAYRRCLIRWFKPPSPLRAP